MHDPECLNWMELLAGSVTTAQALPPELRSMEDDIAAVSRVYPMRINPYYLRLIKERGGALWRLVIPDKAELTDTLPSDDPLNETVQSPVPGIIHRYPDRVIFLVSGICPVLCRFCMRKRLAGKAASLTERQIADAVAYIQADTNVREVIFSGGDPLMLTDDILAAVLDKVHCIPHVEILRIHTKAPVGLPQRVTPALAGLLQRFHPLYINIHVNHPDELSRPAGAACALLADAGIPLGSQTVLLKGVNDSSEVMIRLMRQLLRYRVKPYYLHHPDLVRGTGHFRMPVTRGLAIMREMVGHISGSAVPRYMIDLPGGGGKVPLLPEYVRQLTRIQMTVENYCGDIYQYPVPDRS
ncbi:MAG: KamA family radical SAM protein [Thermodesulfobacteriota bacterium]|nr:KamA family radical SAM protein [Thermodesulfobacteriota bacterium]